MKNYNVISKRFTCRRTHRRRSMTLDFSKPWIKTRVLFVKYHCGVASIVWCCYCRSRSTNRWYRGALSSISSAKRSYKPAGNSERPEILQKQKGYRYRQYAKWDNQNTSSAGNTTPTIKYLLWDKLDPLCIVQGHNLPNTEARKRPPGPIKSQRNRPDSNSR